MGSPKNKIYISVAITVIISLCLVVFGIVPFLGRVKQNSEEFTAQRGLLDLAEARIEEVKAFQDGHSALQQDLNRIEHAFIEADSPVVFLGELEQAAMSAGLPIKISPFGSKLEPDDLWLSAGFGVSAAGALESCLRFLELLEQSRWLFEISQFSLAEVSEEQLSSRGFEGLEPGGVTMTLTLKAYSGEVPTP